jgi:CHAT domain-containing protein
VLAALRGGGWADLPGTRVETDRLRHLLGAECRVLTDGAASEQALEGLRQSGELARFRYLHLATHGQGNAVRAFESALILAQDKLPKDALPRAGEPFLDGRLSAREVLDFWTLDAELVTLSACETAVGADGSGDGALGFAQAFLHAGSRAVCLSLWKVDDTATALLMDRFYQNLLGKRDGLVRPLGKAAALDEAKRWLRGLSGAEALARAAEVAEGVARGTRGKGAVLNPIAPPADPTAPAAKDTKPFAHPKYWAAFVLIGDPN